jgi:hypothetical protein
MAGERHMTIHLRFSGPCLNLWSLPCQSCLYQSQRNEKEIPLGLGKMGGGLSEIYCAHIPRLDPGPTELLKEDRGTAPWCRCYGFHVALEAQSHITTPLN